MTVIAAALVAAHAVASIAAGTQNLEEPICRLESAEKQVALSFDVEWTDVQTKNLLHILKKHQASATLFVVGQWAKTHPESVLRIAMDGCELGNHSMSHPNMQKISREEQVEELEACNDVMEQITGKRPRLFRAPYGAYSPELLDAVREQGMVSIQWDVDSLDWKNFAPEYISDRVTELVRPGSIIRFQSSALNTPTALDDLLNRLQKEGYRFVTVSELLTDE